MSALHEKTASASAPKDRRPAWLVSTLTRSVLAAALMASGYAAPGENLIGSTAPEPQDLVATARKLATSGHRPEALALLNKRLEEKRTDSDARTLRGIILSWDGHYDEARRDLEMVLAGHRDHGDALPALLNVEMWSDHPERAEELARDALKRNPTNPDLLLARARALKAMKRNREAFDEVQHLLLVDPGNQKAVSLASDLGDSLRQFTASFNHNTQWFSDGRTPWHENQIQLSRQTGIGSIIMRFDRANQYGENSQMVEIDAYPHIRPGMYLYLNAGYSPDNRLYPQTRLAADINQSLGHGWEGSAGIRQLHFGSNIHIYTASITKYYGDWMFTGRTFITPDSIGTSRSGQFQVRRYLKSATDYWYVRVGYGSSPAEVTSLQDIQILNSDSFSAGINHAIGRRFMVMADFGYSYEDRLGITGLRAYLADGTFYYRF